MKYIHLVVAAAVIVFLCIGSSMVSAQSYALGVGASPIPSGPTAIISADFNQDGRLDVAVSDGSGVSILLGNPNGTFVTKATYTVGGSAPTGLAVADVNGDGKPDLIVVGSPQVQILLGNGDGTFRAGASVILNNVSPTGVVAGDFNKDGKVDLAVSGGSDSSGAFVALLLGKGDGTFQSELDYSTSGSYSVISGDFNGDGDLDLAVGNGYSGGGGDEISILLGNGDGTFKPYIAVPVPGDGDDRLAAADLNHDKKLDLVVASFYNSSGGISVLIGNGDGTFAPAVSYPAPIGSATNAAAIGDFNGDGVPDVSVTNYDGNDVSVFIGKGDGTFKSPAQYPASINPMGIVTGDFNGDGRQDIASVSGYILSASVDVLIGRGDGTFANHTNHSIPLYPYDIAAGDFNGDGKPDLVVDSFNTPGLISILLGNGNGSFTIRKDTAVGNQPARLATGDFNGDGKIDVVVNATDPKTGAGLLSTLLGRGDGTFELPLNQTLTSISSNFAVADFNLDRKLDLATCLQLTTGVSVFMGKGDGAFAAPLFFDAGNTGTNAGPIFAADFNGDHKPDLAVSTYSGISILLGDGNGSFQPYKAVLPGYSLLAVGDFNGDGKPDLVVFAGSPWVGIALGNGDGTFKSPATVFVTSLLSLDRTIVGDFNGDGKLDIAFISSSEQMLSILPGNGDGTFGQRIDLPTENSPWSLTAAKGLTGGGGLDIAVGSAVVNSPSVVSIYPSRPVGAIYPSSLAFGSQTVGTISKALTTKLYNSGGARLTISSITTTGNYRQTNTCGTGLAVGASCSVSVTFAPIYAGKQRGTLNVTDSSTVKPQSIPLSGTGVP